MKYLIINNKNKTKSVIDFLSKKEYLPKVHRRLNIYSEDNTFQVEILNNRISYKKNDRLKRIYIKNKNLKHFFKILDNTQKYFINDITILKFQTCSMLFDTYHGNIISIDNDVLCEELEKTFDLTRYSNISEHKFVKKPKTEYLFDQIGSLNPKIKKYALNMGLDISSVSSSLKIRLSNISNDYSHLEPYYKLVTNYDLLSMDYKRTKKHMIKI